MKSFIEDWIAGGSIFSSAKGVLIGYGKRSWSSSCDLTLKKPFFYFPDFFLKNPLPWFTHEHAVEINVQEILELLEESIDRAAKREYPKWNMALEMPFHEAFEDLQSLFKQKELSKAVPYAIETSSVRMSALQLHFSLISLLKYSLNNPTYLYGFWDKEEGMLGATPELLFNQLDQKKFETVACAGTQSVHDDLESFLKDPKELKEHRLVVEGIVEALSPYGKVEVGDRKLINLSHLRHLLTSIILEIEREFPFDLIVHVLHPTPALGAFPRAKGKKWLESYQLKLERGRFGAPAGFVSSSQACCYVAIRNVQWNRMGMRLIAGCGVVIESCADREWKEINLKLKAIKEMLAL